MESQSCKQVTRMLASRNLTGFVLSPKVYIDSLFLMLFLKDNYFLS